jgi:hypothetical protein
MNLPPVSVACDTLRFVLLAWTRANVKAGNFPFFHLGRLELISIEKMHSRGASSEGEAQGVVKEMKIDSSALSKLYGEEDAISDSFKLPDSLRALRLRAILRAQR